MKKTLQIFAMLFLGITQVNAQDPGATVGSTGSVTFTYNGQSVTHTSVRAADGKIWLQQNLGSGQVASSATDTASYGHLFQWGRWADGHQLRSSINQQVTTLTNNTPAGIAPGNANFLRNNVQPLWWGGSATTTPAGNPQTSDTWGPGAPTATNGTDPCSGLGAGWRMPTKTEWDAVRTAESITNLATGFSSNLKLPYSGYRNGANGGIQLAGYANFYWTATNKDAQYPYAVYNGGSVDYWSRGYAGTCRCIKEVVACTGTPNGGDAIASLTEVCTGGSTNLSLAGATIGTDIGYQWQSRPAGSGTFTDISGATNTSYAVTNLTAGMEYRCMVTCTTSSQGASSDTVAVSIQHLEINLGNDTSFCAGNVLTLDAGDAGTGATYSWSNNVNTQTTDVNATGQYSVLVTAANGCTGEDTIDITVLTAPTADAIEAIGDIDNNYSFSLVNAQGATSYLWSFGDNGATSTSADPEHQYTQAGTYTVTVVVSNDCGELTLTKTVTVTPSGIGHVDAARLGISLFPNPTAKTVFLNFGQAIEVDKITLTNTLGQELIVKDKITKTFDVSHLANGLYFINIYTDKGVARLKLNVLK